LTAKEVETTESLGQVNETAVINTRSTINGRNNEYNKTGSTMSTSSLYVIPSSSSFTGLIIDSTLDV